MSGSPPPMRGKVLLRCVQVGISRITPAYAGKSAGCHIQPKPDRDHPRLCGEKPNWNGLAHTVLGSPPPMRGKGTTSSKFPACLEDHPRLCGEKIKDEIRLTEAEGSPPPMRGKAESNCRQPARLRITPAYAGKSGQGGLKNLAKKDHPRLCGEK